MPISAENLFDTTARPISHKEYKELFKCNKTLWCDVVRHVIKDALKDKLPIDFVLHDNYEIRMAEEQILSEFKHVKINKITLGGMR